MARETSTASTTEIGRPANAFMTFRSALGALHKEIFKVDEVDEVAPRNRAQGSYVRPYDIDEWRARPCNRALMSSLSDRIREDIKAPPPGPAGEFLKPKCQAGKLSSYASLLWKFILDESERLPFFLYQKEIEIAHKQMYPDYVYRPKRSRNGKSKDVVEEERDILHEEEGVVAEMPVAKRAKTSAKGTRPKSKPRSKPSQTSTSTPATRSSRKRTKSHSTTAASSSSSSPVSSTGVSPLSHSAPSTSLSQSPPNPEPLQIAYYQPALGDFAYSASGSFSSYAYDESPRTSSTTLPSNDPPLYYSWYPSESCLSYPDVNVGADNLLPTPCSDPWAGQATPSSSGSNLAPSPAGALALSNMPLPSSASTSLLDLGTGAAVHAPRACEIPTPPYAAHVSSVSPAADLANLSHWSTRCGLDATLTNYTSPSASYGLGSGDLGYHSGQLGDAADGFDASAYGLGFNYDYLAPGDLELDNLGLDLSFDGSDFGFDMGVPGFDYGFDASSASLATSGTFNAQFTGFDTWGLPFDGTAPTNTLSA
ncbi:unnamed protein product [Peniophora sp. CBMAI 1063]|nr:unnamed protein product [Peniophora sp. CBMAI 1063]